MVSCSLLVLLDIDSDGSCLNAIRDDLSERRVCVCVCVCVYVFDYRQDLGFMTPR